MATYLASFFEKIFTTRLLKVASEQIEVCNFKDAETQIDASFAAFLREQDPFLFSNERHRRYSRVSEVPELPNTQHTVKEAVLQFATTTKMHGVAHAVLLRDGRARRTVENYIFSLALIVFIILGTIFTVNMVSDYLGYPVLTDVDYFDEPEMDFPAITFCNMNKIKFGYDAPNYFPTEQEKAGHNLTNMLISCSFNGETCNISDFTWLWSHELGNCYTFNNHFNSQGKKVPSRKVNFPGYNNSLTMVIDVESSLYGPNISFVGVVVTVHDRAMRPVPSEDLVAFTTGFWNYLEITKTTTKEKESPYCDCVNADDKMNLANNFFADKYNYSFATCRETCLQVKAMEKFKCCVTNYPCNPCNLSSAFGVELDPSIKACNSPYPDGMSEKEYREWRSTEGYICHDLCHFPCSTTTYDVTPSYLVWPRKGSNTADELCKEIDENKEGPLVLQLYMVSSSSKEYKTKAKYDWIDLLAQLGGMLSLFFGFSLPILLEVLVLTFDIVFITCRSLFQQLQKRRNR